MEEKFRHLIHMLCGAACSELDEDTIELLFEQAKDCGLKTEQDFIQNGLDPLWFWAVEIKRIRRS